MRTYVAKEFPLVEPYKFALREKVIQRIPQGFLLLKPLVAGICGSEILYFRGEKEREKLERRLPMCLLHEGVAEVIAKGENTNLNVGDHVIVNPMIPCGVCVACKLGLGENFCQNARYMAATADGLSRTYFLYPESRVLPVPEGVDLEVAALSEPISIALNAFMKAGISNGDKVAVIGDGPIGYLLSLVISYVGGKFKEKLYLIGVVDQKLSLAEDFSMTLNSLKEGEKMRNLKDTFDVVFEAVGGRVQELTLEQAVNLLRPAGKCIVLGLSGRKVPLDIAKVVNKGLSVTGSVRSTMDNFKHTIDLLKNEEFRKRAARIISEKKFIIEKPEDLLVAFQYADTEEGEAKSKPGRVMVYFP